MLTEICRIINNAYNIDSGDYGTYEIKDNLLTGNDAKYLIGSYIAIECRGGSDNNGSILNGGIYKIKDDLITLDDVLNEKWDGYIYQCAIPKDLISLSEEIKENIKNTKQGNKVSEDFGVYSYQKATNKNGVILSWLEVYETRISQFKNRTFNDVRM